MDESVRRMIVDIACDAFPVIIRAASLPASVEWKSNIVGPVDYCPQCVCARSKTDPFRITDAFRKKCPVSTLQIIPVDGQRIGSLVVSFGSALLDEAMSTYR